MSPGAPRDPQPTRAYVPPLPADRGSPSSPAGHGGAAHPAPRARSCSSSSSSCSWRSAGSPSRRRTAAARSPSSPPRSVGAHPFTASVATGHPAPPAATATSGTAGGPGGDRPGHHHHRRLAARGSTAAAAPGELRRSEAARRPPGRRRSAPPPSRRSRASRPRTSQSFVGGLTGVVLRGDTRVTDHGFVTDHPSIYQALLQTGSAVLVDHFGVPRVRCLSGDPLTPPVAVTITPRYVGAHWQGFAPGAVTVVAAASRPITAFVLTDAGSRPALHASGGNGRTCRRGRPGVPHRRADSGLPCQRWGTYGDLRPGQKRGGARVAPEPDPRRRREGDR